MLQIPALSASSLAAAYAPSAGAFVAARAVLGLGGAVILPMVLGVVPTLFAAEERIRFLRNATSDLPNIEIEAFGSLVVEFAREKGAMAIVKGLRAISDFEYELEMNQLNRRQAPEIESVYLMASPKYSFLSSSGVKELAVFGGDIDDLVTDEVARHLKERLGR